jgi:hypothetical protein
MTTAQAPGATADQARRLFEQARFHKREANRHRRAAQEAMQALDRLRADCERLGIRLVLEPRPQPQGGTGHHG